MPIREKRRGEERRGKERKGEEGACISWRIHRNSYVRSRALLTFGCQYLTD
jgi:hypothetical protein